MGDHSACEKLYNKYYMSLYNYGRRFITAEDIVHDVIQDLFVSLLLGEIKNTNISAVEPYLLRVYRNMLIDRFKDEDISCEDSILEFYKHSLESIVNSIDEEQINLIKKVYYSLSKKHREIIYLYYVKENSHNEIATILNIKQQSSKNLLSRAVIKLRQKYYQETKCQPNETRLKVVL